MVTFTTDIQTLLTAITSISLYCEQLKLGPSCLILTKYYQPNKNVLNVYGISNSNGTFNGTLMRSFKTDADLLYYYPDFQYLPSQQSLLHVFEEEKNFPPSYSVATYSNSSKLRHDFTLPGDVSYESCFSNLNQFYCIHYYSAAKSFILYYQQLVDNFGTTPLKITNSDDKLKFYAFDYCTLRLVFESENNMFLVNLYDLNSITAYLTIPKSQYKINFCYQDGGRLKASPMFLTSLANAVHLQSKRYEIGLIDFEICNTTLIKKQKCSLLKEEEKGLLENSTNLIWLIVCIIGLIADIAIIVITVIFYIKTKGTKQYKEMGTETYMAVTAGQDPATATTTAAKKDKGKALPPPPEELPMTKTASTKPQSTILVTKF